MKLTADDIAYLRQGASQRGYNGDDLLKIINYESSGRPDVWGGKGNKYFGIFQAGPTERQKYGIDTVHPTAQNQIDALFGFLKDRGFKPGMGLLDAYSTVNAGSPGHYKASDGNGTVASHVARMLGSSVAPVGSSVRSTAPGDYSLAYAEPEEAAPAMNKSDPIGELLAQMEAQKEEEKPEEANPLQNYAIGLLGGSQPQIDMLSPAPMVQHMQFGGHIPRPNTFSKRQQVGLLGR